MGRLPNHLANTDIKVVTYGFGAPIFSNICSWKLERINTESAARLLGNLSYHTALRLSFQLTNQRG
jgi:hypothetical protein